MRWRNYTTSSIWYWIQQFNIFIQNYIFKIYFSLQKKRLWCSRLIKKNSSRKTEKTFEFNFFSSFHWFSIYEKKFLFYKPLTLSFTYIAYYIAINEYLDRHIRNCRAYIHRPCMAHNTLDGFNVTESSMKW